VTDTEGAAFGTAVVSVFLFLFMGADALAQPTPLNAKAIWAHESRVVLAATDSLAVEEGYVLSFLSRKKTVATAVVSAVYEDGLAVATLASGSLKRVKKLQDLRIMAERPPVRPLPSLRVGYPSSNRPNLIFTCEPMTIRAPLRAGAYRMEPSGGRSYRLVRDSAIPAQSPWPDTLLIRLFDEAADEEIALERGDLDVAVFWPGELSSHMRENPQWRDYLRGTRSRGVLAALTTSDRDPGSTSIPRDSSAVASLNEEVFRGDLQPWSPPFGRAQFPETVWTVRSHVARRFEVDRSCPGWQGLERSLNRGRSGAPDEWSTSRLTYLDAPIDSPDSLSSASAEYVRRSALPSAIREGAEGRVKFLFAIRCPVVCPRKLRAYVGALGADAFVDVPDCRPARREP